MTLSMIDIFACLYPVSDCIVCHYFSVHVFACVACLPNPGSGFWIFVSPILHAILDDT